MTDFRLHRRQIVPGDLTDVFRFFEDPWNLETITPPWLRFRIMSATDRTVELGTLIRYRLSWQGLPMRWESRISEYEPGVLFADEMLRGPYRRWYHRHLFRQVEEGVEVEDIVDYRLPFGPIGPVAHRIVVRRQLEAIFDFRHRRIAEIFGHVPVPEIQG